MQKYKSVSSLDELGVDVIVRILKYLTGKQSARLSTLSRTFKKATENEELWKLHLCSEFGTVVVEQDESKYTNQRCGNRKYYKDLCYARKDAQRSWERIKNSTILAKKELNRGVDESTIMLVEDCLEIRLPLIVKEVYRIHDGQSFMIHDDTAFAELMDESDYANRKVDKILPLEEALFESIHLRERLLNEKWYSDHAHEPQRMRVTNGIHDFKTIEEIVFSSIVVAEECKHQEQKLMLIRSDTNEVYLWTGPFYLTRVSNQTSSCNPMLFLNFFRAYGQSH